MSSGIPGPQGLYEPAREHDACGIGFIASIKGVKSHAIVSKGIEILANLTHRGATGCDPETGDGAGILIQIPHAFFARECTEYGFRLPGPGEYGVGMVFLPVEPAPRLICEGVIERICAEEGLAVLGWRDTPVNGDAIGRVARGSQPYIEQVFIAKGTAMDEDELERRLYVVRKRVQREIAASEIADKHYFYIPSLSARTIVYKGLLLAPQIERFYEELSDHEVSSALCLVHQRFSTNTFPSWSLAHPYRYIAHNGEINTLRGNLNWMHARQSVLASPLFDDVRKLFPIVEEGGSDSAAFDNVLELLVLAGRSLPHAMAMLIPATWSRNPYLNEDEKAFYEFHSSLMEPWDGPAAIAFTDGRVIGATLDRNGLRPARYEITEDDHIVMASETGVLPVPPEEVKCKGRLRPGRMLLVDTVEGRIVSDAEIKATLSRRRPYAKWIQDRQIRLEELPEPPRVVPNDAETLLRRRRAFGYTEEDLTTILGPMAATGEEPIGSMGDDTPPACLSDRPQRLFDYFKQLFAQVTNPPIDPIREEMVMSLVSYIGTERNILDETPDHCHTLKMPHPVLTNRDLEKLRRVSQGDFLATTIPSLYLVAGGEKGLRQAVDSLCRRTSLAIKSGYTVIILSDRGVDEEYAPIPSLLALSAVHKHLVREETRTQVALVVESGEPREVTDFALLVGYGASAVNPYLAIETIEDLAQDGRLPAGMETEKAIANYVKAVGKGLLKILSKMGISTLAGYKGAQVFEAVGLKRSLVDKYFTGTSSHIEGIGMDVLAEEARRKHAYSLEPIHSYDRELDVGGRYRYRLDGEKHLLNPDTISNLQHAVRADSAETFRRFSELTDRQNRESGALRGLLDFKPAERPIPLDQVEPASEIVKRFATGAMSFGSLGKEVHETVARAMNSIGGKSNTGEGGEDEARFHDDRRSAVKQVASARFGVTASYLVNADELQIKMAQGAKPGEGGQLPGAKVDTEIARVRHSVPGVTLISPPPHHDIYSIEDLSQLVYDLKNVNPKARIAVKLVSEVGVGTVAAGVSKARADVVLISGDSGGTGASPISSIKHTGVPWELGLAEAQQVLVLNDLRGRIRVQVDGKLMTGRDVTVAALLGAEEFGFSTAPLVSLGCVMMRKCHLNTCPVGIATQDPTLRAKFQGKPEHLIRYFFFVAEEVRKNMALLGFRRMDEMIGRTDRLIARHAVEHYKARGIDVSSILYRPPMPERIARRCVVEQRHPLDQALDNTLVDLTREALESGKRVEIKLPIRNVHRSVGAMLSGEIARRYGSAGLPDDTIRLEFTGSAGQSFGAFLTPGISLTLEGDANDAVGKGLSGGRIAVFPHRRATFAPEENIVVGNAALYGATSGEAFLNGVAGERFAVRNSGAFAVVEGVGDHGCEYMTNGIVVVLGETGRNFAAGMHGGLAYVYDEIGDFADKRCNQATVELERITQPDEAARLRALVEKHLEWTGSPKARRILKEWDVSLGRFVKVLPVEFKRLFGEVPCRVEVANG
jgi:glutamate synthase domain-containing protein 2/glutamate synthase domain-containing protein 1/glutamate synthase domain-containing protein 3